MVQVEGITNRINELTAEEAKLAEEIADLEIKKENALTIIINERNSVSEKRAAIAAPISARPAWGRWRCARGEREQGGGES